MRFWKPGLAVRLACGVTAAAVVGAAAGPAVACRTPVFRYAMLNWPVSPYYVFCLHHGRLTAADEALHRQIEALANGRSGGAADAGATAAAPAANVLLTVVDAGPEEDYEVLHSLLRAWPEPWIGYAAAEGVRAAFRSPFERIPPEVIEAWRAADDGRSPLYLVYTPWGEKLYAGQLDEATLRAMCDSPARRQIGKLLHEGNAVVWLVAEGRDAQANAAALKAVESVMADCASGKLVGPPDPEDQFGPADEPADGDPDARKPKPHDLLKVGLVRVAAADPAEKWLTAALEEIAAPWVRAPADAPQPDEVNAAKLADGPRVYAVFGRGRAMPPFMGEQIVAERLADGLLFLAGPCSCILKDDKPGLDLLMAWDWDATAERVATAMEEMDAATMGYQEIGAPKGTETSPAPGTAAETADPRPPAEVPPPTVGGTSGAPAAPLPGDAPAEAAATQATARDGSFAERQSGLFAVIILIVGGAVFAGGIALLLWQRAAR